MAVPRDAAGRLLGGQGALNPGGLTAAEREAKDAVRRALSGPLLATGLKAYQRLLEEANPLIVKDWVERVAGKVKERVTLEDDAALLPALRNATLEQILEIVRSDK